MNLITAQKWEPLIKTHKEEWFMKIQSFSVNWFRNWIPKRKKNQNLQGEIQNPRHTDQLKFPNMNTSLLIFKNKRYSMKHSKLIQSLNTSSLSKVLFMNKKRQKPCHKRKFRWLFKMESKIKYFYNNKYIKSKSKQIKHQWNKLKTKTLRKVIIKEHQIKNLNYPKIMIPKF